MVEARERLRGVQGNLRNRRMRGKAPFWSGLLDKARPMLYLEHRLTCRDCGVEEFMKILAVEDEPEYLELLEEVLTQIGHTIRVASNGVEALKVLEQEAVDVILADVAMPEMDGIQLHETIRAKAEYARTPFIFLTGVTELEDVKAVCKPEVDMLLQKPFPVDQLLMIFSGKFR